MQIERIIENTTRRIKLPFFSIWHRIKNRISVQLSEQNIATEWFSTTHQYFESNLSAEIRRHPIINSHLEFYFSFSLTLAPTISILSQRPKSTCKSSRILFFSFEKCPFQISRIFPRLNAAQFQFPSQQTCPIRSTRHV